MKSLILNRDFISPFLRMARDLNNIEFGQEFRPSYKDSIINSRVDVYETDKTVVLTADMPGIKKEDISVDVTNKRLTIKAEKKCYEETEKLDFHLSERMFGFLERSFELPDYIDTETIKADYESGVLKLTMDKKAETQPKKIEVAVK